MLEAGGVNALIVAGGAPEMVLLTNAERAESLRQTLAARPAGEPVWLFGLRLVDLEPDRCTFRWSTAHRARIDRDGTGRFASTTPVGRGTVDNPGLVLGLDRGEVRAAAWRIRLAEKTCCRRSWTLVWRREMVAGSYIPRWLDRDRIPDGEAVWRGDRVHHRPDRPRTLCGQVWRRSS